MSVDITGRSIDWRFRDRIPEVRQTFMKKIKKLQEEDINAVYIEDIEKTMKNDYWVEKFLEWNLGKIDKTADGIIFSLKFQKKYRVRELQDSDFASEVYSTGSCFRYERDKLGRLTLFMRMKYAPACKETRDLSIQFATYIHYKMERDSGDKPYVCINDYAGTTKANFDIALFHKSMEMIDVFPNSVALFICVNFSFSVRVLFNGLIYLLPESHKKGIRILSSPEDLQQIIPIENLPDFLGGTCTKLYRGQEMVPEGCVSFKEGLMSLVHNMDGNNNEDNEVGPVDLNTALLLPEEIDRKTATRVVEYYSKLLEIPESLKGF